MEWSDRSLELYPEDMSALVNAACLRAKCGLKEEAVELLERVFARGWGKRDWVAHDPDYDILLTIASRWLGWLANTKPHRSCLD